MASEKLSKDRLFENAIISSINNPRHCLYYRETSNPQVIAKTLMNSNETFELRTSPEYETSIHAHEQIHIVSSNQTQFKRILLFNSLIPPLEIKSLSNIPAKITSYKPAVDFLLLYNSEVIPYLEAFAILYQCRLQETPLELREALIQELSIKQPALYGLLIDIEDIFEKILEKNKSSEIFSAQVYALATNLVFSTPNITEDRIFDRFRLLREIEKIPKWKTYNEITTFFRDYFHHNNHQIILTALGTTESIIETAQILKSLKQLTQEHSIEIPQAYLFGVLSEIDIQMGRISYFCENLETLEGKNINYCYLGTLAKTEHFMSALNLMITNTSEMLKNQEFKTQKNLLKEFIKDVKVLLKIKENVFKKCPGPSHCKGKTECPIRKTLYQQTMTKVFKKPTQE